MLQLIWGILNISIVIFFIVLCFKAVKHIREKIGLFAAIIFSFCLLSFMGGPKKDYENKKFSFENKKENTPNTLETHTTTIILEDNLVSQLKMLVQYNDKEALSAITTTTGLVSGTNWRTDFININKTNKDNFYRYHVEGVLEWKLAGVVMYSQLLTFEKTVEFKKENYYFITK